MIELKDKGGFKGSYRIRTWDKLSGALIWDSGVIENLIVTSTGYGVDIVTKSLGDGGVAYSIKIDSAAIGTGNVAPTAATTALTTPVLTGILVADTSYPAPGQVLKSFFIADAQLANGTYKEFAIYCNSRLFAMSLITPNFTKGSNQNTTVDYTITLTAS